jgi:hypothetical protein
MDAVDDEGPDARLLGVSTLDGPTADMQRWAGREHASIGSGQSVRTAGVMHGAVVASGLEWSPDGTQW